MSYLDAGAKNLHLCRSMVRALPLAFGWLSLAVLHGIVSGYLAWLLLCSTEISPRKPEGSPVPLFKPVILVSVMGQESREWSAPSSQTSLDLGSLRPPPPHPPPAPYLIRAHSVMKSRRTDRQGEARRYSVTCEIVFISVG